MSGKLNYIFSVTYGRADAFIVLAKAFAESLRQWGVSAPIFIDTTTVNDELLRDFSIDRKVDSIRNAKELRILYLARLERKKGVLELVEAVKRLLDRGVKLSLTIAGDGPVADETRTLIDGLGQHQDSVQLVGYVRGDEKVKIFESHHIYCFPTQYGEGMPNSVLEAMAFGLPVVTCPVGGVADFFEDNKMGILLKETNPDSIASSILELILNRVKLLDIARYNYSYAQRRFLSSTTAEILRGRYIEILITD